MVVAASLAEVAAEVTTSETLFLRLRLTKMAAGIPIKNDAPNVAPAKINLSRYQLTVALGKYDCVGSAVVSGVEIAARITALVYLLMFF